MPSARQVLAAQTNGRKSRGPKTPEGKRKSSANSAKHGLNSKTPPYDAQCAADHIHFRDVFTAEYHPANPYQHSLVEIVALAEAQMRWVWRAQAAYFNAHLEASPDPSANPLSTMFRALRNDPSREYDLLNILENRHFRQSRAARRALEDADNPSPKNRAGGAASAPRWEFHVHAARHRPAQAARRPAFGYEANRIADPHIDPRVLLVIGEANGRMELKERILGVTRRGPDDRVLAGRHAIRFLNRMFNRWSERNKGYCAIR